MQTNKSYAQFLVFVFILPQLLFGQSNQYLFEAVKAGDTATVRFLLNQSHSAIDGREFNPEIGREDGVTALHLAVSEGLEAISLMLLKAGADSNLPTAKGWTPLHLAAETGNPVIARYLMDFGARPNTRNDYGYTPLGIAQGNDDTLMARLILDMSGRLLSPPNNGTEIVFQTSLHEVHTLEFSTDTNYLLINDNLFEVKSGKKVTDFDAVMASFSQKQPFLYTLEGKEGIPTLWNWRSEEKIGQFTNEGGQNDFLPRNPYYDGQKIWESSDGRMLITRYEGVFKAWDILSGKEIQLPLLKPKNIASISCAGNLVLTAYSTGQIAIYQGFESSKPRFTEKKVRKIVQAGLIQNGALFYNLYEPIAEPGILELEVWDWQSGNLFFKTRIDKEVAALDISPDGSRLAYATVDTSVYLMYLSDGVNHKLRFQHNGPVKCLRFSPGGAWLLLGSTERTAHMFDVENGRLLQTYESLLQQDIGSKIGFIEFSPDGRHIHTGVIGKLFDLYTPEVVNLYSTESALSADGIYLVRKGLKDHANNLMVIRIARYLKAAKEGATPKELANFPEEKVLVGNGQKPGKIEISPDNAWVAAFTDVNTLLVWNLQSGNLVFSMTCAQKADELSFSPDSKHLILRYSTPWGSAVFSTASFEKILETPNVEYSRTGQWIGHVQGEWLTIKDRSGQERMRLKVLKDMPLRFAFSHNEKWLVAFSAREGLALWDIEQNRYIRYLEDPNAFNRIAFSPDDRYLAIKIATRVEVWETETGRKILVADEHTYTNSDIAFSPDSRFLALAGDKGYSIVLWELDSLTPEFRIFFPGSSIFDNQYIITTQAGPYLGSKLAAKTLSFKQGQKIYPFDQFDLAYNRPDQVLERLGFSSPDVIQGYRNAYEKRRKKMGFEPSLTNQEEWSLPEVEVFRSQIPIEVEKKAFSFRVSARDQRRRLKRIQIFINNVPHFGSAGLDLGPVAENQFDQPFEVVLSGGENKVEVSVFNDQGVESLRETFYVFCADTTHTQDLYLIALGVEQFSDSVMNLRYPVKDAENLAAFFSDSASLNYSRVFVEKHFNQEVDRALLQQLKTLLMESQVDDHVILYVAGHGLVDENLDYYLASHDTDFVRPAETAIPYEALEFLLDSIPARQKLFLLDACHSGEIDKESVALIKEKQTSEGKIQFRAFDTRITHTETGLEGAFEAMKLLFLDLRRGTGAVVISSASALEFAMEGELWDNGVFVYCLLKGLTGMAADIDKNGQVMVSELQQYLAAEVPLLTDRQQQPVFRVENIQKDWLVWKKTSSKN